MNICVGVFHDSHKFRALYYRNNSVCSGKPSKNIRCFPTCFDGTFENHSKGSFCGQPVKVTTTCALSSRFDLRDAKFCGEFCRVDRDEDSSVYSTYDDLVMKSVLQRNGMIGEITQSSIYMSASGIQFISVTVAFNLGRKAFVYNAEGNHVTGVDHTFRVSVYYEIPDCGWQFIVSFSSPRFAIKCTRRKKPTDAMLGPCRICARCGSKFETLMQTRACVCGRPIDIELGSQLCRFNEKLCLPECPPGVEFQSLLFSVHANIMNNIGSRSSYSPLGEAASKELPFLEGYDLEKELRGSNELDFDEEL